MEAILAALDQQHSELATLLDRLDDDDWKRPTRCEGWFVADVVLHLAQTDELALASLEGRYADGLDVLAGGTDRAGTVDDGAAAIVAHERGMPSAAILERWRAGAEAVRDALAVGDPHRRVVWVAGELSTQTLAATRLAECWIHTGDVADALGVTQEPTDGVEHIARLAWRTLPYAFAREGRELAGRVRPACTERGPLALRARRRRGDGDRRRGSRPLPGGGAPGRARCDLAARHGS